MNDTSVTAWVVEYERLWRSPGTAALADAFTEDAEYRQGPYEEPRIGLEAIARMWDEERDGPDEVFALRSAVIAVYGDTAVVRAEVDYGGQPSLSRTDRTRSDPRSGEFPVVP